MAETGYYGYDDWRIIHGTCTATTISLGVIKASGVAASRTRPETFAERSKRLKREKEAAKALAQWDEYDQQED